MEDFLFVIDGYLSNYQRVSVCDELIVQLKKFFPDKKILLINKFNNSFGIESKVDYYFYYGDGFMVGEPPKKIIEDTRYCRPYVYFDTGNGVLENWTPHVGVSDHVANVYNGFILSSKMAKVLGYEKVFRIEYDMLFDIEELKSIQKHIKNFEEEDYLIYGRRKEGSWMSDYISLIDIHFCGFSCKMFEGFDLVKNDLDFWDLCDKIRYWGKWCEYVMSMVFEVNLKKFKGTEHHGFVRETFKKSFFDRISSSGFWENKWMDMPRICRVTRDGGMTDRDDEIVLFYWNNDADSMVINVETNFGYQKEMTLDRTAWSYEHVKLEGNMKFNCTVIRDGVVNRFEKEVNKNNVLELDNRFLYK